MPWALQILNSKIDAVNRNVHKAQPDITVEATDATRELLHSIAMTDAVKAKGGRGIGNLVESGYLNGLSDFLFEHRAEWRGHPGMVARAVPQGEGDDMHHIAFELVPGSKYGRRLAMTELSLQQKPKRGTNHPVNEDRLLLDGNVLCYGLVGDCEREMGCMAVFDGVSEGGHGTVASTLAAQAFAQATQVFEADSIDVLQDRLRMAGERAENDVESYAAGYGLPVAASTVAGLMVAHDGSAAIFNAGDSRVSLARWRACGVLAMTIRPNPAWAALVLSTAMNRSRIALSWRSVLIRADENLEINTTTLFPGDRYLICYYGYRWGD